MLLNLNKVNWGQALKNRDFKEQKVDTERMLKDMAKAFNS